MRKRNDLLHRYSLCPVCSETISVNEKGMLRLHPYGGKPHCEGSGFKVAGRIVNVSRFKTERRALNAWKRGGKR